MIGADTQNTPYTLLFDFMEQGSLTTLLRDGRELLTKGLHQKSLSHTTLNDYILQILKGMEFLASHHIAHGSLRGSAKFLISFSASGHLFAKCDMIKHALLAFHHFYQLFHAVYVCLASMCWSVRAACVRSRR